MLAFLDYAGMPRKPPASEIDVMAGRRLRAVREAMGIGQAAFGHIVGVERTTLANWEAGRLPDVRAMVRLMQKVGVPLDWIYAGYLRNLPYEVAEMLEARAADLGAVVGGPVAEWPMEIDRRPGLQSLRAPAAVPAKRLRRVTFHEPASDAPEDKSG